MGRHDTAASCPTQGLALSAPRLPAGVEFWSLHRRASHHRRGKRALGTKPSKCCRAKTGHARGSDAASQSTTVPPQLARRYFRPRSGYALVVSYNSARAGFARSRGQYLSLELQFWQMIERLGFDVPPSGTHNNIHAVRALHYSHPIVRQFVALHTEHAFLVNSVCKLIMRAGFDGRDDPPPLELPRSRWR